MTGVESAEMADSAERFHISSSTILAKTRPRPPGSRRTGILRSRSQTCAVRTPTPRYAAISFHEDNSSVGVLNITELPRSVLNARM